MRRCTADHTDVGACLTNISPCSRAKSRSAAPASDLGALRGSFGSTNLKAPYNSVNAALCRGPGACGKLYQLKVSLVDVLSPSIPTARKTVDSFSSKPPGGAISCMKLRGDVEYETCSNDFCIVAALGGRLGSLAVG